MIDTIDVDAVSHALREITFVGACEEFLVLRDVFALLMGEARPRTGD
jgi:hypothetical protein